MAANDTKDQKENKAKALQNAIAQIERQFGKGSIMRMEQGSVGIDAEVIPTGSLAIDLALGIGGLPKGRIVELYGHESSGKTTLALHVIAEAQKRGETCVFVDAENAFDRYYAEKLGLDLKELLVTQPDYGEQALDIVDTFVRSGSIGVIVVDSVAALTPKAEVDGEMGATHVGLQARLMSQALRKITATVSRYNVLVIFINQIRMKIGISYGNPETTTGGNALKFYSSIRLEIKKGQALKTGEEVVGNNTTVKVVKNKLAPPFRIADTEILYGTGISKEGEIIDIATKLGVINRSGAWYDYKGEKIGQGKEKVRALLKEKVELANELETIIKQKVAEGINLKPSAKGGLKPTENLDNQEDESLTEDEI
ncbi:recombinase RecA [Rickettsiales bacterium LUAb2]